VCGVVVTGDKFSLIALLLEIIIAGVVVIGDK
jgi:hypothetical protein